MYVKNLVYFETDTQCGFRHLVPCLINDSCTLDTEKSGCHYDAEEDKLVLTYEVNLFTPVWSFEEQNALANKNPGRFQWWDCSSSYDNVPSPDTSCNHFIHKM